MKLTPSLSLVSCLVALGVPACGGSQAGPQSAEQKDEGKAARLLARARESQDPEKYRQIVQRFDGTRPAADARIELANILIGQAEKSLAAGDYPSAEDRAQEARIYGDLERTERARKVLDTIDDKRAAKVAEDAAAAAAEGKCASALKSVAGTFRKKPRERFKREVQKLSQTSLVACLAKKLEEEIQTGGVDAARQMLETPDATTALSNEGYKAAHAELTKLVVRQSTKAIDPKLADKKWEEAIAILDGLKGENKISEDEYKIAFGFVQEKILADLLARARAALTSRTPSDDVKQIESTAKIAQWQAHPEPLEKALGLVKVNLECEKLGCTFQKPAGIAWTWGEVGVSPAENAAAGKKSSVKHATQVWIVARGRERALIATEDPGNAEGEALMAKVSGWADVAYLKPTDTEGWLPPTDQLVNVRVWGPLRPGQPEYHLGTVSAVDAKAKKVTVKRMADNLDVTIELSRIRAGRLRQGLKVMAFCVDQLHPETARVDKVVTSEGGVPKVKVICDKGNVTRVEIGGSLTSRADWLPPRKP